jgi:hypothetical protein
MLGGLILYFAWLLHFLSSRYYAPPNFRNSMVRGS